MSLVKARIENLEKGGTAPDFVEALFNPKEYTFSKSNSWAGDTSAQANAGELQFTGGQNATLKLQLVFDTYHLATASAPPPDVRGRTDGLWQMMQLDKRFASEKSKHGRPPKVKFFWGNTWAFDSVIESISQQFTLFLPSGIPVRAIVDLTLKEAKDHETLTAGGGSGAAGGIIQAVRQGDSLARIANDTLGNAGRWREIADLNKISNVRNLMSGSQLKLPGGL